MQVSFQWKQIILFFKVAEFKSSNQVPKFSVENLYQKGRPPPATPSVHHLDMVSSLPPDPSTSRCRSHHLSCSGQKHGDTVDSFLALTTPRPIYQSMIGSSCRIDPAAVPFVLLLHWHPWASHAHGPTPGVGEPQRPAQMLVPLQSVLRTAGGVSREAEGESCHSLLCSESPSGPPFSSGEKTRNFHLRLWTDTIERPTWSSPSKQNVNHCSSTSLPKEMWPLCSWLAHLPEGWFKTHGLFSNIYFTDTCRSPTCTLLRERHCTNLWGYCLSTAYSLLGLSQWHAIVESQTWR